MKELRNLIKLIRLIKLSSRILFVAVIALSIVYSIMYLYTLFFGSSFITKKLEEASQRKVSIGFFHVTPLLNLEIKNLNIKDFINVDTIFASPSKLSLIFGRLAFNKIIITSPKLTIEKKLPEKKEISAPMAAPEAVPVTAASAPAGGTSEEITQKTAVPNFVFKHLSIKDGEVNFIDHTVGGENGITITAKDIFLDLSNLYSSPHHSIISNIHLKGRIPWRQEEKKEEGKIEIKGWFDLFDKDMEGSVQILDIDGVYLYPYYSQWVDLEKARIEQAKLNFTSNIHGLNNNLTAECHLELTDIVFKPRSPEEQQDKAEKLASALLDIFKDLTQGKIVLDFTIRTKMDRPEFGFGQLKTAVEDKITKAVKERQPEPAGIFKLPVKIIEGTVKGATDLTTSVITGTIRAGAEIGKAVGDAFKKEKKE